MCTIAIAGTFDTKGEEFLYVKKIAESLGLDTLMIHTGVFEPTFTPDVSNSEVAQAAGYDISELVEKKDRALATEVLSKGMRQLVPQLYDEGKFDGIISFGGSGGTSLVTPAMRKLPIGVPKLMVSTMASGNIAQYVGTSDIIMMPSIVDVAGLNAISKTIYRNAVLAIAGMVGLKSILPNDMQITKPLIAATMFGVTTPCINAAKEYLEKHGYEVLVFHCTGTGGKTMESLINAGYFKGVLDITTTEWADQVVGGVLAAGEERCEAAINNRIPQVTSVGACDMVNFGPIDTVPSKFSDRKLYKHNPTVTLMRTTVSENVIIGRKLAEKWNLAKSKMVVMLPAKGISAIDAEKQPFNGVEERFALFSSIRENISNPKVKIEDWNLHINDINFAEQAADTLMKLIEMDDFSNLA